MWLYGPLLPGGTQLLASGGGGVTGSIAVTESADTSRFLGTAELGPPILLDAMGSEATWTQEWGSGGAWVANSGVGEDLTRNGPVGTNWVSIYTGTGNHSGVTGTGGRITKTLTAVDLSGAKNVAVYYALDSGVAANSNPDKLYSIELYLGSDGDKSFANSVKSVFELGTNTSETATIGDGLINHAIRDIASDFTTHAGTMDWSNVQDVRLVIYGSNGTALAAAGSQTPKVFFQGLQANIRTTPTVVFAHDDSPAGMYTYGRSRYAAYGWLTTQFVIPGDLGAANVMTEAEVSDLYDDGHDICLHATYSGATLNTLTGAQIDTDLQDGLDWLDTNGYTRSRHIVSWPQGVYADSGGTRVFDRYADKGVTIGRTTKRYYNSVEAGPWAAFDRTGAGKNVQGFGLKWLDIKNGRDAATYLTPQLDRIVKYGGVLIVTFHNIVASGAGGESIDLYEFEDTLALVADYEADGLVTVKSLSEVFPRTDLALDATESSDTASFVVDTGAPDEVRTGGDDKPDRGHRGYGTKRATLKRDRDREFDAQIREMYRDLLGDPRTAERAEEIVAAVTEPVRAKGESESARESALMARAEAMRKRADAMDAEALQAEIALRFLHQKLRDMQEDDDMEALIYLLPEIL